MIADTPAEVHYQIHSAERTPALYERLEQRPQAPVPAELGASLTPLRSAPYQDYVRFTWDVTPVEWPEDAHGIAAAAAEEGQVAGEGRAQTVEDQNRVRLALLAREFARKALTPEDAARLEVASARVQALLPRVAAKDFEDLEQSVRDARAVADRDALLRKELGLDE